MQTRPRAVAPVLGLANVVSPGLRGIDVGVPTLTSGINIWVPTLTGGFDVGVHLVRLLEVVARTTTNILRLAVSLLGFLLHAFSFNLRLLGFGLLFGGLRLTRPAIQRSFTALLTKFGGGVPAPLQVCFLLPLSSEHGAGADYDENDDDKHDPSHGVHLKISLFRCRWHDHPS